MEGAAAARTCRARRLDHDFLARQMSRQMSTIDTALANARRFQRRVGLLLDGFPGGDRALQILEAEIELIFAQLFGFAPEVISPKLTQHVHESIVLRRHPVAFGNDGRPLGALGEQQRFQALDVVGQIGLVRIGLVRHARDPARDADKRQRSIPPRVNLP
jgi:hypothetical protein